MPGHISTRTFRSGGRCRVILVPEPFGVEEGAGKRCSDCGSSLAPKDAGKHEKYPTCVKYIKKFCLVSNNYGFI